MTELIVTNLAVHFATETGVAVACDGVNFIVPKGTRLGLVGESGSGKTTTALSLIGMLPPTGRVVSGSAVLEGTDLLQLDPQAHRSIRLARVSYMPQAAMNSLNPVLRVRDQILHGLIDHGVVLGRREADARVAELLADVDLPQSVARQYPHQLSGGMKQRVCLAIAVSMVPDLIIADEPTSALDVITQRRVMAALDRMQKRINCSLILISHDMGLMAQFVDNLAVMQNGRIVEQGPVDRIFAAPAHSYTRRLISAVAADQAPFTPPEIAANKEAAEAPLLTLNAASVTYDGSRSPALHPVSMTLRGDRPVIVSIVGQSGSGKSTLAGLMLGLQHPSIGTVSFRGHDIARMNREGRFAFRRDVQAVFQDPYATFNPFFRVSRTITFPIRRFGIAASAPEAEAKCREACRHVGLDPDALLDRYPHELSGGQRQRLMVARALTLRPRILVADEPVSMIDASMRASVLANLAELRASIGLSVIYITHDLTTARLISDYVIVLSEGRVVEAGTPSEVINDPQHPYTRLLVDSIPWPDPSRSWGTDQDGTDIPAPAIIRSQIDGFALGIPKALALAEA